LRHAFVSAEEVGGELVRLLAGQRIHLQAAHAGEIEDLGDLGVGRFDLSFKSLAESSPLTLLRLFGHVPVDEGTRVEPVERELAMSLRSVDHAFLLKRGGESWLEHFEAELVLSASDLLQILRRATLLSMKMEVPVWTTIVLLSRRHAGTPPDRVAEDRGCLQVSMKPRVVALWEIRPDVLLAEGNVDVLPLVSAMKATPEELREAMRRLARVDDREQRSRLTAELVTWSSLNYNKEEVSDIRASLRMVTTKEVLMASPIGEELVEYGREEGELIAARQYVTLLVESRFPSLIERDVIETITDPAIMQELFHALLGATDPAEARAAITRILGSARE
jgi:hypothetical protein